MTSTAYRPPKDRLWFLRNRAYTKYVVRELTGVLVAWTIVYLLLLMAAVFDTKFQDFVELARQPWMIAINIFALVATTYHAVTFLNLAPKATVVRLDGWRVPAFMMQGGIHSAWLVVSAVLAYLVLRG